MNEGFKQDAKSIRGRMKAMYLELDELRQVRPMDVIDETLADIASDTKGESWMLGYNTCLDEVLKTVKRYL